jgi:hypothetical protein
MKPLFDKESETHQHVVRRAAEPYGADVHAALYAPDERL